MFREQNKKVNNLIHDIQVNLFYFSELLKIFFIIPISFCNVNHTNQEDNMKVELKNIKVSERMSEETICFTANIYIDGKKVGSAENNGCGGATTHWIADKDLNQRFENYVRSLPAKEVKVGNETVIVENMTEFFLHDLVEQFLIEKDQKKIDKKTKVIFIANPNNPTGTWITHQQLLWFVLEWHARFELQLPTR